MSFRVTQKDEGMRLDRYLQKETALSRKKVKGLLDQGQVYLSGRKVIIASWQLKAGNFVEIREPTLQHPASLEHFLKVVYEDPHLIVVEKDAGTPCEPTSLATTPTLVEIINAYFKRKQPYLKGHYLGPVHRLDRETSGLMIYTKIKEANRISEQFKQHTIVRKYLVVVTGKVEKEAGTLTSFLKKSDLLKGGQKVKLSTPASGQKAVTHWRLKERYDKASLLEVSLNTGRTHQIRVQMASIGHPVVGDKIYGGGDTFPFARQALHASWLGFRHPITGKKMEFESKLPRDLRHLVDRLRIHG